MGKCRYRCACCTIAIAATATERDERKRSQYPPPNYDSQVSSLTFRTVPALAEILAQRYLSLASSGMELAIILADLRRNRKGSREQTATPSEHTPFQQPLIFTEAAFTHTISV